METKQEARLNEEQNANVSPKDNSKVKLSRRSFLGLSLVALGEVLSACQKPISTLERLLAPSPTATQSPRPIETPTSSSAITSITKKELPMDILSEEELKRLGITLTNTSEYHDVYLRRGFFESPIVNKVNKKWMASHWEYYDSKTGRIEKADPISKATLDIVIFGGEKITIQSLENIKDTDLKERLEYILQSYDDKGLQGLAPTRIEKNETNNSYIAYSYILVNFGVTPILPLDDLPKAPSKLLNDKPGLGGYAVAESPGIGAGTGLSRLFRHESKHHELLGDIKVQAEEFYGKEIPYSFGNEFMTDLAVFEDMRQRDEEFIKTGDDRKFWLVIRDKRNGNFIRVEVPSGTLSG